MKQFLSICLFAIISLFILAVAVSAEDLAIEHATLYPITSEIQVDATILLRDGKIQDFGKSLAIPAGVRVIDGQGLHIMPGMIDTHSHMGVYAWPGVEANSDGNEATNPITPNVDALDSVNPQDPAFKRAAAGGATTVQVLPGSANLIGGKSVTLHVMPDAYTVEEMIFQEAPRGLKMAMGENPKRNYGSENQIPSTRMGNMFLFREAFTKASEYKEKWNRYNKSKEGDPPVRDLRWETLGQVLDGKILVHVHCYRADEMLHMLQLADDFKFKITSFQHTLEGYKVADALATKGVGAATWADWWGFKVEAWTGIPWNAAYMVSRGVTVNLHTDSSELVQRMNIEAAKTLKYGMSEADALKTITIFPAKMLGIDSYVGSIDKGKNADLVVFDGPPLSIYSHVVMTMVNGKFTYDRQKQNMLHDASLISRSGNR